METVRSLFDKARALLNEFTEEGVQLPEADYVDMLEKSVPLADMAQKELFKVGRLFNTFEFDNKPAPNLLGNISNFDIKDFTGTVQYYPNESGVAGAKAYYFEVTRSAAVVTIEELQSGVWTTIHTPTITPNITSYTAFKGVITPLSSNNPIRMKFSGISHYRHINRCLFSYPFVLADIPDYKPWYKVTMPSNFRSISQITEEFPDRQYAKSSTYKWEGFKDLYVNYYYEGKVRVIYKPIPTTLNDTEDVLEIDDITSQAIVYYIAARLAPFKKKELVNFFESKFLELKLESTSDNPVSETTIIDVYNIGGGN
jgi:hypothetical protein